MAKNAKMDAKDIAALFRSYADAGYDSRPSEERDPSTFADQNLDIQFG